MKTVTIALPLLLAGCELEEDSHPAPQLLDQQVDEHGIEWSLLGNHDGSDPDRLPHEFTISFEGYNPTQDQIVLSPGVPTCMITGWSYEAADGVTANSSDPINVDCSDFPNHDSVFEPQERVSWGDHGIDTHTGQATLYELTVTLYDGRVFSGTFDYLTQAGR